MVWQKQMTSPNSLDYLKSKYDDKLRNEFNSINMDAPKRMGSKVSAIANIFQSMTPVSANFKKDNAKIEDKNHLLNNRRKTFPSELDIQQKQLNPLKNNIINKSKENENGKENEKNLKKIINNLEKNIEQKKTKSESRINRFNNAKAIFEKMEFNGSKNGKVSPNLKDNSQDRVLKDNSSNSSLNSINNSPKNSQTKEKKIFDILKSSLEEDNDNLSNKKYISNKNIDVKNNKLNEKLTNEKNNLNNDKLKNNSPKHQNKIETSKFVQAQNLINQQSFPKVNVTKINKNQEVSKDDLIDKVFSKIASNSQDVTIDFNKLADNSQNFLFQKNNTSDFNLPDLNSCDTSGITEILDRFVENSKYDEVDLMTEEEANKFLCKNVCSLKNQFENEKNEKNEQKSVPSFGVLDVSDYSSNSLLTEQNSTLTLNESSNLLEDKSFKNNDEAYDQKQYMVLDEDIKYYVRNDGNFYYEKKTDFIDDFDNNEKSSRKVRFNDKTVKVYSTYTSMEYDRRNDEVDPVAASAEYELEKRIEKMNIIEVELDKGNDDLGFSIIGMGVGADAGLEKLGIFIKAITPNGPAQKNGQIFVNDQIIEVNGKCFVGVTQEYATNVLKSTSGKVKFLIGREKDSTNSEIANLILRSLESEKQRNQELENSFANPCYFEAPNKSLPNSPEPDSIYDNSDMIDTNGFSNKGFGNHGFIENNTAVFSLKEDLKNWIDKYNQLDYQFVQIKEKMETKCKEMQLDIENLEIQLNESHNDNFNKQKELEDSQKTINETKYQYGLLEKKYHKAKKLIKGFQQRENGFSQKEQNHFNQLQEKDLEYTSLINALKERIILLERKLIEVQKAAGLPISNESCLNEIVYDLLNKSKEEKSNKRMSLILQQLLLDSPEVNMNQAFILTNEDLEDLDSNDEYLDLSDDLNSMNSREILDSTFAKDKAGLISKSSLANRNPPSTRRLSNSYS